MKVTKYVHSCLKVEHEGKVVLIDPGEMSWESGLIDVRRWEQLDEIVISHEHFDHMFMPFIEELLVQFPKVKIITTEAVKQELAKQGISQVQLESSNLVQVSTVSHESMVPLAPPPGPNLVSNVFGLLTHPGDSHHIERSEAVLCLPLAGPWAATIEAVRMADHLGPHIILPIHDWMWSDPWKRSMYDRLEAYFTAKRQQFIKLKDGEAVELSI